MIIKSTRKKISRVLSIKFINYDSSTYVLEKKDHIKYLGVLIDDSISWKYQISYICSRISSNASILLKLRNYLPLTQLKQLYYSLIYPHISYAIIAWGRKPRKPNQAIMLFDYILK